MDGSEITEIFSMGTKPLALTSFILLNCNSRKRDLQAVSVDWRKNKSGGHLSKHHMQGTFCLQHAGSIRDNVQVRVSELTSTHSQGLTAHAAPHKLLSVAHGACGSTEVLRFYLGSWEAGQL